MTDIPIRNAATIIAIRDPATRPCVLMGQRGTAAAFMADKVVFPGGAVDPGDAAVPLSRPLPESCAKALAEEADPALVPALAAAAVRELWEETGLALGVPGTWTDPPPDWQSFAALGLLPSAEALRFVFRAITPPGRPRRFDARFFLTDAAALTGDPDDFSRASDELSRLQWIPLDEVQKFDLPAITKIVLRTVAAALPALDPPSPVPFLRNGTMSLRGKNAVTLPGQPAAD